MALSLGQLCVRAQLVLGFTQAELGAELGVSRRTVQRWTDEASMPSVAQLRELARLVFPQDASLATAIAQQGGVTLEALGLQALPEAPVVAPPAPPVVAAPAIAPALPAGVVDAVVCAAAETMDLMPREVRPGLLAAFARAREIGLTVEAVEQTLRATLHRAGQGESPNAPSAASAQATGERKRKTV